eukprot:6970459-Prymnesium_polylepis.1
MSSPLQRRPARDPVKNVCPRRATASPLAHLSGAHRLRSQSANGCTSCRRMNRMRAVRRTADTTRP